MLRATIAGRTTEWHGCDSMRHSDKFSRFGCDTQASVDFHIDVRLCEQLPPLNGEPDGVYGALQRFRLADGRSAVRHANGERELCYDPTFSRVTLTLKENESADMWQYLYALKAFSYHLLAHDGSLLHGAGLSIASGGIVLAGRSGVGKSTMATLLQREIGATVLSEDAPALIASPQGWQLCGTPFCGGDERCENGRVPLKAIVLLAQSDDDRVSDLSQRDALFGLLPLVPRPLYCEPLCEAALTRVQTLVREIRIMRFDNTATATSAKRLLDELARRVPIG